MGNKYKSANAAGKRPIGVDIIGYNMDCVEFLAVQKQLKID